MLKKSVTDHQPQVVDKKEILICRQEDLSTEDFPLGIEYQPNWVAI